MKLVKLFLSLLCMCLLFSITTVTVKATTSTAYGCFYYKSSDSVYYEYPNKWTDAPKLPSYRYDWNCNQISADGYVATSASWNGAKSYNSAKGQYERKVDVTYTKIEASLTVYYTDLSQRNILPTEVDLQGTYTLYEGQTHTFSTSAKYIPGYTFVRSVLTDTYNASAESTSSSRNAVASYGKHNVYVRYEYASPPPTPQPPTGFSAVATGQSSVNLYWNSVSAATSYKIFRDGIQIQPPTSNCYFYDTGLSSGTTYKYYVKSSNAVGDSEPSTTVYVTTYYPPTPPPVYLTSISIQPKPAVIKGPNALGGQLSVTAHYSNGGTEDITQSASITSNNSGIAYVTDTYPKYLYSGSNQGTAVITASYGGYSDTFAVTVDYTPPAFTVQYYSDSGLSVPLGSNPRLKPGTYYLKITSSETLSGAPTISINAEGTANDVNNSTATLVSGNTYKYTRTIASDTAAVGSIPEDISVSATDSVGNTAVNVNPTNEPAAAAYTDTVPPTIAISAPSTGLTKGGTITYTVAYTGADAVTLAASNITLNKTGTANGTIAVSGTGTSTRTVTISGITGDGTLSISIAAGTAKDNSANMAPASGPSTTFTIDSTAPPKPILEASPTSPTSGNVTVAISNWGDATVRQYRINGGEWSSYTVPVIMTENGLVEARGVDQAENISEIGSIAIANIIPPGLSSLSISEGILQPLFRRDTTDYNLNVGYEVRGITVTPTTEDTNTVIKVNGIDTASGKASGIIDLNVEANTVTIDVTAVGSSSKTTYKITITRTSSPYLAGLTAKAGRTMVNISPSFSKTTLEYAANVSKDTSSINIYPSVENNSDTTMMVNNTPVSNGKFVTVQVNPGVNYINVTSVSTVGGDQRTYVIKVTKASSAYLSSLAISSGTFDTVFSKVIFPYTACVGYDISSITVVPKAEDSTATIMVNNSVTASEQESEPINLNIGKNIITVKVTPVTGNPITYTIEVTRSSNAYLSNLVINDVLLYPLFSRNNLYYAANVSNDVTSITMLPTVEDNTATVAINGTPVESSQASAPISLNVGTNIIMVQVKPTVGKALTYELYITRDNVI